MFVRKFLFLQGMATPFFKEMANTLHHQGHEVFRVNFCGGDRLFSTKNGTTWDYTAPISELPEWLKQKHQSHQFTDVILFGDTRPIHRAAFQALEQSGVCIHVYEEGYLRPNWITLEQSGVNGYSDMLRKPRAFWQRKTLENTPAPGVFSGKTFGIRGWYDFCYRLANAVAYPYYRHYRTHRPYSAIREYLGWGRRFSKLKLWRERRDTKTIHRLLQKKTPYYLLPLQLHSDSQIQVHSRFKSIRSVISEVMHSFAKFAPPDTLLLIKNHPLDTGITNHERYSLDLAKVLGIHDRIVFLESGHLPTLLPKARGTVLVNSTVGTSALFHRSPLIALGTAIYDMPGLTFQDGLDRFWAEAKQPDRRQYQIFKQLVIEHTQIAGNFYSRQGRQATINGSIEAMGLETSGSTTTSTTMVTSSTAPPPPPTFIGPPRPEPALQRNSQGGHLPLNVYQYKQTET